MTFLLKTAFNELGTKETSGTQHNPRIVQYAREANFPGVRDDETPWCSIFVNWVCEQNELEKSGKANARSWLATGNKVTDPFPGDVVIFWRESVHSWKGHVALFLGYSSDKKKVFCIGGNQGDSVSIAAYDAGKVLGFRRVSPEQLLQIPDPVLRKGDQGEEVIKLQQLLNHLDCPCGDADGAFGNKTVAALKLFQANHQLDVDGVYGNQARDAIETVLQA